MKQLTAGILLITALSLVTTTGNAQQNLFNIPSGDITPKSKVFYQHQINIYSVRDYESKSHVVFGLGKGWDIGVNLVDLPIRFQPDSAIIGRNDVKTRTPLYPFLMATIQKQFVVSKKWLVNVGTQVGPNITRRTRNVSLAHFTYATVKWHPVERCSIIAGPYYSNNVYTGDDHATPGWMLGYEFKVTDDFLLMGDLISGDHKKSVSTFGFTYNLGDRTQVCLAALLPFPNTELQRGMVLELNLFGWDYDLGE